MKKRCKTSLRSHWESEKLYNTSQLYRLKDICNLETFKFPIEQLIDNRNVLILFKRITESKEKKSKSKDKELITKQKGKPLHRCQTMCKNIFMSENKELKKIYSNRRWYLKTNRITVNKVTRHPRKYTNYTIVAIFTAM